MGDRLASQHLLLSVFMGKAVCRQNGLHQAASETRLLSLGKYPGIYLLIKLCTQQNRRERDMEEERRGGKRGREGDTDGRKREREK